MNAPKLNSRVALSIAAVAAAGGTAVSALHGLGTSVAVAAQPTQVGAVAGTQSTVVTPAAKVIRLRTNKPTGPALFGDTTNAGHVSSLGGVVLPSTRLTATASLRSRQRETLSAGDGDTLPATVSLKDNTVGIVDQGKISSCVGWTVGYELTGWYARKAGMTDPNFAAYYVYSQLNGGQNVGTDPAKAVDLVSQQGVAKWVDYPQQAKNDPYTVPDSTETAAAAPYKLTGKNILFADGSAQGTAADSLLKAAIASGHPVAISMFEREGLVNHWNTTAPESDSTTPILVDENGQQMGHEMLAVGYSPDGLLVQNSWGKAFGDQGFTYLSWNVVEADVTSAITVEGFAAGATNTNTNTNTDTNTNTNTNTTDPQVTAPTSAPSYGSTLGSDGTTPYEVKFSAKDGATPAATALDVSVDGAPWAAETLASATATSITLNLMPGHSYQFAAAAKNASGVWSDWATGVAFNVTASAEGSAKYTGTWAERDWADALDRQLAVSTETDATVSFTYTGSQVAVISTRAANRGSATVFVDGVNKGTMDLYTTATAARAVSLVVTNAEAGSHTVTLVLAGSADHPAVDVDGFIVTS